MINDMLLMLLKLIKNLGWKPSVTFEEGLSKTIDWYLENEKWLNNVIREIIRNIIKNNI